jgi:hypothetical protein
MNMPAIRPGMLGSVDNDRREIAPRKTKTPFRAAMTGAERGFENCRRAFTALACLPERRGRQAGRQAGSKFRAKVAKKYLFYEEETQLPSCNAANTRMNNTSNYNTPFPTMQGQSSLDLS